MNMEEKKHSHIVLLPAGRRRRRRRRAAGYQFSGHLGTRQDHHRRRRWHLRRLTLGWASL